MVRNLLENAARHNRFGGWVRVEVRPGLDGAVLEVSNSVRAGSGADHSWRGPRTGLTIVSAVLDAHGGSIEWDRADGHVVARATLPGDLSQPEGGGRSGGMASSPSKGSGGDRRSEVVA
jgi:hypothetical protein